MHVLKVVKRLVVLDGERIKLKESVGDALVEKVGAVEEDQGEDAKQEEPWVPEEALWGEIGVLRKNFDVEGEISASTFEEKDFEEAVTECRNIMQESEILYNSGKEKKKKKKKKKL